jgi:hypothetical protein
MGPYSKDTPPPPLVIGHNRGAPNWTAGTRMACQLRRNGLGCRTFTTTNPLLHPRRGLSALSNPLRQFPLLTIMCQGYQEARFLALQEM